jgi:hypothetical protein
MIRFDKLNIDSNIIEEIINIGNSCGVISCYLLSLIYKFPFDINEFRNIGIGMTPSQIQEWAKKNGIFYICKETENNKPFCVYSNYNILLKNNIILDLSANNLNGKGRPHTSLAKSVKGNRVELIFLDLENAITQLDKLEGLYMTFYYKDVDVNK